MLNRWDAMDPKIKNIPTEKLVEALMLNYVNWNL